MSLEELARRRAEFDKQKEIAPRQQGVPDRGLRRPTTRTVFLENVQVTRPFEGVKILDFTQVLAGSLRSELSARTARRRRHQE